MKPAEPQSFSGFLCFSGAQDLLKRRAEMFAIEPKFPRESREAQRELDLGTLGRRMSLSLFDTPELRVAVRPA